jgi:glycosyltransferase involved in cell wall biosynthesis
MTQPTITMITAALNPGPEVRQTIESVLSQEHSSVEYIFVDGGSRAEAFMHVEPYRKHFATLIQEPDEGISDAWNKAIARATGKIIGIINADDYLLPGALRAVADAHERHAGSPIVHGGALRIEKSGETLRYSRIPMWLMLRFGTPVVHPATFVPKAIYDRIGGFDKTYRIAMDYDFILRAYRAGAPFVHLAQPLVGFRGGGLSDRKPLEGFREVRDSQLANGFNRPLVEAIHAAKFCVRKYVRPMLGIG